MNLQRKYLAIAISSAISCPIAGIAAELETTLAPVVTSARRIETKLDDVPQRVEVITSKDIDKTIQNDLTDLLKKNASVDIIQYPSALSGIGIRGFRPEFSGISRHTVTLIDGRPISGDNLALINVDSLSQVEVMKGPGSALYGSGAMGGVVSMISRQSKGDIRGQANISYGDFNAKEIKFRAGGSLNQSTDFDYTGSWKKADDFKLGNGDIRPYTKYEMENHSIRGGLDINKDWRLIGKYRVWYGRDIGSPGDLAYGTDDQSQKQMDNADGDLQLTGRMGDHSVSATTFSGTQDYSMTKITSRTAAQRPRLPAVSLMGNMSFSGWQAQDAWAWSQNNVVLFGIDTHKAKSISRSFNLNVNGVPEQAPGTANHQQISQGIFVENSWTFNKGNSTAYAGIRRDNITVESLDTPLRVGFTPSKTDLTATNPSAGFKHLIATGWNVHGTIGKAFLAPSALQSTGNHDTTVGTQRTVTLGNSSIKPESSLSKDIGVEWSVPGFNVDLTVFDTKVTDKIVSVKTVTAAGGITTTTTNYVNSDQGSIQGLELQSRWAFAKNYQLTLGGTRFFHNWYVTNGQRVDENNVPRLALKIALDADFGQWTGRVGLRYRGSIKDQDWVNGGGAQIVQDGFTVADLNARYRIDKAQSLALSIENLTDRMYTEKFGYNMSGRNIRANYRYDF
ncbi:MAG: TonB-dependent receptor [Sulfurisoma sp.]|nr:TonB-dependent receptor [Sulfurisoma sp.]